MTKDTIKLTICREHTELGEFDLKAFEAHCRAVADATFNEPYKAEFSRRGNASDPMNPYYIWEFRSK